MGRLEFEQTVKQFEALGNNARATLMFRMIQVMGPALLRTVIKYCHKRLDQINGEIRIGQPDSKDWDEQKFMLAAKQNTHNLVTVDKW